LVWKTKILLSLLSIKVGGRSPPIFIYLFINIFDKTAVGGSEKFNIFKGEKIINSFALCFFLRGGISAKGKKQNANTACP